MNQFIIKSLVINVLILISVTTFSQQPVVDLTTPLAVDPNVKIGKLENGLVYYIRQNNKPERRSGFRQTEPDRQKKEFYNRYETNELDKTKSKDLCSQYVSNYLSQMENQVKFMKNKPMMAFYDTLFKSVYPGYKRLVIFPTLSQLNEVKLDQAFTIYKDRFADASDFKFFIVGNFSVDSVAPLIEKYFGSLPGLNRNETWKDNSPKVAAGITNLTVYKGTDPQGMVGLVLPEAFEWNEKNLRCMNMILQIMIRARETDLEKTEFWLRKIESLYFNHDAQNTVSTFKDRVNAITINDLKMAASACLKPDHYIRVVLMPEKT